MKRFCVYDHDPAIGFAAKPSDEIVRHMIKCFLQFYESNIKRRRIVLVSLGLVRQKFCFISIQSQTVLRKAINIIAGNLLKISFVLRSKK